MRRHFLLGLLALPLLAGCATPGGEAPQVPVHVVFFTEDSAALDEAARAVVADAARLALEDASLPVRVMGFADPDGGRAYNRAISAARAEQVAAALRERGVPAGRISVSPRGPVPFEMMPLESRRVEIVLGGQAAAR
ncbi:cell envelope biogenesis protein OmpA [Pseudoroseomonas rhizosphaerae]|uniref:Cell envelope biogenesis protein OmpA n=1 Tax=Teichococcus rhizosphaerae TaxID=1335062 RepID=A0A2C7A9X0_9PROT|nr:OmpA family protein [Pseudoroseomonas rhizosphaerae]PHK96908.1 cell envelope biogenesis protein OmpA [Pseudoroseomonas rhizosphaerae]